MKKILLVFIAFSFLSIGYSCGDGSGSKISMYVVAGSGLRIREDSTTESKQVGLVPYGKKVTVLEQSDKTMTISGKKGHWTKVSYEGIEGWSFGGFLSATPPEANPSSTAYDCNIWQKCYNECKDIMDGEGYSSCTNECAPGVNFQKMTKACR